MRAVRGLVGDERIAAYVRWIRSSRPTGSVDAVRALLARVLVLVGGTLILAAVLVGPSPRKLLQRTGARGAGAGPYSSAPR